MYVSKKIIEAHGGKIWAKNNQDGKGVTFGFSLPVQDQLSNPDRQLWWSVIQDDYGSKIKNYSPNIPINGFIS